MRTLHATSRSGWWGQALQNNFIALVLAMVVIVPLFASPADSRLSGMAALTFETFALLLATALLWRARWSIGREQVVSFLRTGSNAPVLLLLALAIGSCILSPNKVFAVQETIKIGAGVLLYFVVAYQFRQSKHLLMLVDTLLFLAITVSLVAMAQYTLADTRLGGERGTALFGNQQPLGSLLMVLLPIAAVIALTEKQLSKRQIAAQVATVMTLGSLLLAHTRSAWIGGAVGLLTLGALVYSQSRTRKPSAVKKSSVAGFNTRKHQLVVPLMLLVVAVAFVLALKAQNGGIFDRMASVRTASQDASFQQRQNQWWAGSLEMIKARPLGWGPGQYQLYQHAFTGEGASREAITSLKARGSLAEQAHNFYLQLAVELGIPGLILFVAVLGSFFVGALKRLPGMDPGIRRNLLMGSMAALVAFGIDAMSSPSWQYAQVSMFFWIALGAGVGCMRPRSKQEESAPVIAMSPRFVRPVALVGAALMFSLVVMPTAALSAPEDGQYGDSRNTEDFLWGAAGIGLAYLLFGALTETGATAVGTGLTLPDIHAGGTNTVVGNTVTDNSVTGNSVGEEDDEEETETPAPAAEVR